MSYIYLYYLFLTLIAIYLVYFWSKSIFITKDYQGFSDIFNPGGPKASNFLFWVLLIPVYITLLSIIFLSLEMKVLTEKIWIIAPGYWIILYIYITFILKRRKLIDAKIFIIYGISSCMISYIIYEKGISKGLQYLLPDQTNFTTELWILLLVFMYGLIQHATENPINYENRKVNYIREKKLEFISKHKKLLNTETALIQNLILSIMIYENYQRPSFIRSIERKFNTKTTGIMQVSSNKPESDHDSIIKALKIIKKGVPNRIEDNLNYSVYSVFEKYNPDPIYASQVSEIYYILEKL